jgi:protoporphyrinogen oxidase
MTNKQENWAVIGGGALGLTLAMRLAQNGKQVTVLEASNRLGGLADAWELGGVQWDRHYHVMLLSDFYLRGVLQELGLGDAVRWSTTKTDFYTDGRFHPLTNALDYLRFPPLGMIDKARLAGTILYAARIDNGLPLEHVPLKDWLMRFSGRRTYERIWLPLLRAKLGENHHHASAAFIWAIIRRLYAARRSGLKTEMFGYLDGGYARVFEKFEAHLKSLGIRCETGAPAQSLRGTEGKLLVRTPQGERVFDRAVVTTAAPLAARICEGLNDAERAALNGVLYQGIVCASVVLKRPLRGCYITYIADENSPFTAVIEMSALVDKGQFDGHSLVYLPCYATSDDPVFQLPDEIIEERFLNALFTMYPGLSRDDVVAFRVSRVRQVLAVATLDYSARLPAKQTSIPGLHIVNSAHIVNGTLNVNETIKLAEDSVPELLAASWPDKATGASDIARVA